MTNLTFEIANDLLRYEADTGRMFWRERDKEWFPDERAWKVWNTRYAGAEAFTTPDGDGYLKGRLLGERYRAHRVIWLLHTGSWPSDQIDHINGNKSDNRIENLRDVSGQENLRNQRRRSTNTSGYAGVSWHKRDNRWSAQIWHDGRKRHLGLFKSRDEAVATRKQAEKRYGYHPNHGA